MSVTIKEIADRCGVSPGTVDRAINNRSGISEKTKKRVMEAVKQLNYRPDFTGRSLARGRTMTLGVVLFDLHNRSFAQLMNAIELRARELGYFVHLVLTDKDPENEMKCLDHLISRKVDGIILFSVNYGATFEQYLESLNVPIVTIGNHVSDKWKYIGINDRQAMKEATGHAVQSGYESFVYICPPLSKKDKVNIYTQLERYEGFRESLRENGITEEPLVITKRDYLAELATYDQLGEKKTAIICSCDYYALEVLNYLKAQGTQFHNRIGLMGFDNLDVLKYVTPKLSTVEYNVEDMGRKAVECLIAQLDEDKDLDVPLLDYQLIAGESL